MSRPPSPPVIPPFRFACIESGIYRGAYPSLKNLRHLTRLNLRTIISLIPDASASNVDLSTFCTASGITHHTYTVAKYNDGFSHTPQLVAEVLGQMLDATQHPLLLHCLDGRENTGIVVMCLRKLQNWGLSAILDEFARYTKGNMVTFGEQLFVQMFPTQVRLPRHIPDWFLSRVSLGPCQIAQVTQSERTFRDSRGRHAQAVAVYSPRLDALNVDGVQLRRKDRTTT